MEIAEFEKAFRAATRNNTMQPALATPGASIQFSLQLPEEFRAAAKSLAERSPERCKQKSIMGAAAQWA